MKKLEGYMHGVDFGGWLSQCDHTKERYDGFITESDFKKAHEWGLDHVRIPVDYELVEDANGDYVEEGFEYIERAYKWATDNGLNMILDLHKTFGYSFDPHYGESGLFEDAGLQERFIRLWEEFARRYGDRKDHMCFELLNEVTNKEFSDSWNDILTRCIERIRKIAPDIKIITGGYHHNSIEALKDLAKPHDENVVYTFHFYEPHLFTHQGASWMCPPMDKDLRIPFALTYKEYIDMTEKNIGEMAMTMDAYDGDKVIGDEYFDDCFREAVAVAEERDVALYCGEYGVIENADPKEALKWLKVLGSCFERYGIGRALWNYKEMDFGLLDSRMDEVRDEILKVM